MNALYASPTAAQRQECAKLGITSSKFHETHVAVWPEAWPVICLFRRRLVTQWRASGFGVIGLDYNIVYAELARMQLSQEEHDTFMDMLSIVEQQAMINMQSAKG